MKHLAFWIIVGAVVVNLAAHRHRHLQTPQGWSGDGGPPKVVHVRPVSWDDGPPPPPAPPKAPRKISSKANKAKQAPSPAPAALPGPKLPPEWWPHDRAEEEALAKTPDSRIRVGKLSATEDSSITSSLLPSGVRILISKLSATEDAARKDLRHQISAEVGNWLAGDVPRTWEPATREIEAMILDTYIQPVAESIDDSSKDLDDTYILYRAGSKVDFSSTRRAHFVGLYNDHVVQQRMIQGGGVLGFTLIVLAALAGYIRADEATKGYYTNRLRLLAAAGVGAAGVVIYQILA
jgi:hypothetical protein